MHSTVNRAPINMGRLGKAMAIGWLAAAAFIAGPSAARADDEHSVHLVTQNMYVGSEFSGLAAAQDPQQLAIAVATIYNNILATKPDERAAAMALEIVDQDADLVMLQEAALLRTGTGGPATTVKADLLQSLLDALEDLGQRYVAVAIVPGLDAQAPSALGFDVRVTDQNAILVRADLMFDGLDVSNLQIERFGIKLTVPTSLGPFSDPRGWASIDVKMRGRRFRLVTTHLDSASPLVRIAQAGELLQTAANTSLPVIIAGDTNIPADDPLDPSFLAYQAIINAGFIDAWQVMQAPDPGFTAHQTPDLLNPTSTLNHRVDLVLFRGGFDVTDISLIGDQPGDRTTSGLWPSDHAGVAATLQLPSHSK